MTTIKDTNIKYRGLSASGKYEHGYLAIYELVHHANLVPKEDRFQYALVGIRIN